MKLFIALQRANFQLRLNLIPASPEANTSFTWSFLMASTWWIVLASCEANFNFTLKLFAPLLEGLPGQHLTKSLVEYPTTLVGLIPL